MPSEYVQLCLRVTPEDRAQLDALCAHYTRVLVEAGLEGKVGMSAVFRTLIHKAYGELHSCAEPGERCARPDTGPGEKK